MVQYSQPNRTDVLKTAAVLATQFTVSDKNKQGIKMSAVCQFHQHGHCKFGRSCEKFHTVETCDSFPCPGIKSCSKRHPKLCQYFAVYGWCRFNAKCSFLHYSLSNSGHHTASEEVQEVLQTMAELREVVRTLRLEVDRLGNENRHLLEMVEELEKETYGNEDMQDETGLEMEDSKEELGDEHEPSVEEYCDELGRERYMTEQRCTSILVGIIAIFKADKNGEAAGKVRKSGCLNRIEQLRNHRNAEISTRAQEVLSRLFSEAGSSGDGGARRDQRTAISDSGRAQLQRKRGKKRF